MTGVIDTVIVTAQKREQIPARWFHRGHRHLRASCSRTRAFRDIKDLTILTPGLIVTTSTSNESFTTARIRGIGTVG